MLMKKSRFRIITAAVLIMLCCLLFFLFFLSHSRNENRPYEPDTPAPDPHSGLFISEYGTMEFNGDKESITIDFNEKLAELTGLPEGKNTGTYAFLSGDLPPHGSRPVRYDAAHEMRIVVGDVSAVIDMAEAAADGSAAYSGIGTVTSERIPMTFHENGKYFSVIFEKQ